VTTYGGLLDDRQDPRAGGSGSPGVETYCGARTSRPDERGNWPSSERRLSTGSGRSGRLPGRRRSGNRSSSRPREGLGGRIVTKRRRRLLRASDDGHAADARVVGQFQSGAWLI